ncbi:hypothetical protein GE061_017080 [Apolygus lucorum]|uniref:Thioredoxin domain-containing protein n=1 Tax=Apolygus lucorum TaxID=248454 RepID=A0A8S9XI00_APOLU|nr:hypothetical protein GE061_017080 [Apolygus lucorum]
MIVMRFPVTVVAIFLCVQHVFSDQAVQNQVEEPRDVTSVSKFIKEFHRQLEKDLYPIQEPDMPSGFDLSLTYAEESYSTSTNRTSCLEKNHTSVVNCYQQQLLGSLSVELVNSTRLITLLSPNPNVTSRHMEAQCVVLLFYARSCPFSCLAAPHFNALPRAFPAIKMAAVNAMTYQSFNTQYGIAGVPTVILFHNGRAVAKFNDSEYTLKHFARFIQRFTGIKPAEKMFLCRNLTAGGLSSKQSRTPGGKLRHTTSTLSDCQLRLRPSRHFLCLD